MIETHGLRPLKITGGSRLRPGRWTRRTDRRRRLIAADYINHNPFVEDGREANRAFWTAWFAAFPDTTVTLEDVLVDGDRVAGRLTYRATFTGPFLGIEPSGGPVVMRSLDIWRVRDGWAVEHWDEINTADFLTQLTTGNGE